MSKFTVNLNEEAHCIGCYAPMADLDYWEESVTADAGPGDWVLFTCVECGMILRRSVFGEMWIDVEEQIRFRPLDAASREELAEKNEEIAALKQRIEALERPIQAADWAKKK